MAEICADPAPPAPGKAAHAVNDNSSRIWVVPDLGNLECMHSRFRSHCFAPHTHETFVLGHVVSGSQIYNNKGEVRHWGTGSTLVINPDDLHDCRPGPEGSEYRTFYPDQQLMRDVAEEVREKPGDLPYFKLPQLEDRRLSAAFATLHPLLEQPGGLLERETRLREMLAYLVEAYSDCPARSSPIGEEEALIRRVCEFVNDNLAGEIGLTVLADLAGMDQYRLIRSFRKYLGVSPHVYRMNRRISRAKGLLTHGKGLAETALSCGFYDQAHFTKNFKRAIGVTPKAYQKAFCQ